MLPVKAILKKLLLFLLYYFLLVGLFNIGPVQQAAVNTYGKSAKHFLTLMMPKAFIQAESKPSEPGILRVMYADKHKVLEQVKAGTQRGIKNINVVLEEFNIRLPEFFLYSLLFFLALLWVTPLDWKPKIQAAVIGLLLLLLFSWLKLWCYTLYYATNKPIGIYEMKGWAADFVINVYVHLKVGIGFLAAALTWAIVTFRSSNWKNLLYRLNT